MAKPDVKIADQNHLTIVSGTGRSTAVRTVLIADDDALVRSAVKSIISAQDDLEVTCEVEDGARAMQEATIRKPDLLLLDLNMPNKPGLEALRSIGSSIPGMKTVVLTVGVDRRQIVEAIQLGASGVVLKAEAASALIPAIHSVLAGKYWIEKRELPDIHEVLKSVAPVGPQPTTKRDLLSAKEFKIVQAVAEGCTNKDIAGQIGTTEQVVKNNLGRIFDKLGVFNRLELALYALDNNFVERA